MDASNFITHKSPRLSVLERIFLVGREDLREIWGRLETLVQYGV
jgi:hypothetical protein